jgi:hypothetical protein
MITRPLPDQNWTESERAEIRRLEKLCDASEHWTLECSQTDIGDVRLRPGAPKDHPAYRPHREPIRGGVTARATICEDGHHGCGLSRRAEITEATRVS